MAKMVMESKYIASIWPGKVERVRMSHGPAADRKKGTNTFYELQPVPKGKKPFVLEVHDSFEHPKNVIKSIDAGHPVFDSNLVPVEEIVDNLMRIWTGNLVGVPGDAKPGIMEIVGTVPTQAELEQMRRQQAAFMEYWFMEGDRLAREGDHKQISPIMILAADYLGRARNWSHPSQSLDTIKCPACKKTIPEDSYVCSECGTKLRALPPELAELNSPAA